jgi:hypothetical protein
MRTSLDPIFIYIFDKMNKQYDSHINCLKKKSNENHIFFNHQMPFDC